MSDLIKLSSFQADVHLSAVYVYFLLIYQHDFLVQTAGRMLKFQF